MFFPSNVVQSRFTHPFFEKGGLAAGGVFWRVETVNLKPALIGIKNFLGIVVVVELVYFAHGEICCSESQGDNATRTRACIEIDVVANGGIFMCQFLFYV